jgi:[protein-PII] uridylyltransferase
MRKLQDRRAIIDRAALQAAAVAAYERDMPEGDRGQAMLGFYRKALDAGRMEIRRRFELDQSGTFAVQGHCFLIDQLVRVIYDVASEKIYPTANPTSGEQMSVVAYGGYGRGELAPKSDVDLLFVLPYKKTPRSEQMVEHMLYTLWDLGLKVGHATRSVDDCIRQAKADMTIRTGLLEARFVWGEQALFRELRRRFLKDVAASTGPDFVEAKLRERDERHRRMGDSRYVLEPNVKDGKGGLRDLHTLFWLGKYLYSVNDVAKLIDEGLFTRKEVDRFDKAQDFLWTVRCHLHYLTERPEERLTFDLQPELARRMGYRDHAGTSGVERFMKHYFLIAKDVGDLTRIFCAALEARHQRRGLLRLATGLFSRDVEGFSVRGGRITVASEDHFARKPIEMLRLFEVAHRRKLDIHPEALRLITRNLRRIDNKLRRDPEANRLFLDILTAAEEPELTLRRLNEAGVFGRFVTDFGRVVAQMQYDMYHVYTTDEHTIRAIGILNQIERGELYKDHPLATEVIHKVLSREALYVAVLLHDIAKGRGGDHSEIGAELAKKLCPRLGLTPEQTETVSWLVLYHLMMSNTAFKRDLSDPKTIQDFVAVVQSPERLRLLLCLTVADIRAVGPGRWNNWKATLLRDLYYRAEAVMAGGHASESRRDLSDGVVAELRSRLADWPEERLKVHIERGHAAYWLSYDGETLARHARFIRESEAAGLPLAIDRRVEPERAVTEITIYTTDHPGLFSRIAGALAVSGANIVDAKINTLNNGMALDSFLVQDESGEAFARPDKLAKLSVLIEQTLSGRIRPLAELGKRRPLQTRTQVFKVEPRVLIDNKVSNRHTVIEVNGRDRPGLLYAVTRALANLSLQVYAAKISTYGEQVVDVFYAKDLFGMKVEHPSKVQAVHEGLIAALRDPDCAPAKPKKKAEVALPRPAAKKAPRPTGRKRTAKAKSGGATSRKSRSAKCPPAADAAE